MFYCDKKSLNELKRSFYKFSSNQTSEIRPETVNIELTNTLPIRLTELEAREENKNLKF